MSQPHAGRQSGQLAQGAIPGVLRDVYVGRKTGLLSFLRGWERRSVRFVGGNIVHADTNAPGGHLGDLLVRHGLLRREDLSSSLALVRRGGQRLGVVLVEQGLIERDLLDDVVELHVADTLVQVFAWHEGQWEFDEQAADSFKDYDVTLRVSTGDLILQAVRGVDDPDVLRYCLGDLERVLALSGDPLLRFQRVKLSPSDAFLLSRVDGTLSARQVLAVASGAAEEAERALFGLLCIGLVEYTAGPERQEAPPPATLRAELVEASRAAGVRTHFEVLGVAREASDAAVRAAYLRLAQRYHPDIQHDPELSGLKPQIEAAFARVGEAYKVLADPERRVAYEATLLVHALGEPASTAAPEPAAAPDPAAEQQRAEDLLAAAEALSSEGKHWDALRQCEDLLPLAQGKTRRRARVLLAECYLKNPHWRKQAEAELLDAIQEDAENAEALLLLGRIYRQEGMPTRAAAMLRRVLELRPRHAAAAQELAELSGDAPPVAPRKRS